MMQEISGQTMLIIITTLIIFAFTNVNASAGDSSMYYKNCIKSHLIEDCIEDGLKFKNYKKENTIDRLVRWRCIDECKYICMWRTVKAFQDRKWDVPQFHGKWPFIRYFGMQEPASVIFSVFNLVIHIWGLFNFRKKISKTTSFYYMWQCFSLICINAWIWSSVFHTRDTDTTELLDYSAAYAMILNSFYCMLNRSALHKRSRWYKVGLAIALSCFFYRHFVFLVLFQAYSYNMKVNIATGSAAGVGWLVWALQQRKKRPYVKNLGIFVILSALALSLEVLDFPPILFILDAHALWHFVTAPITIFLYRFILDDCSALADEEEKEKIP